MNNNPTIAVIGATGKTGRRVTQRLQDMGYSIRPLSRQSTPAFDWLQPENWLDALNGVDSVYITFQPDLAIPQAQHAIKELVTMAIQAGVKHLVLLSGRGEDGAQKAEHQVQLSGLEWNVIRASWFMQNFSESFMLEGLLNRELVLPEAKTKEPFIDTDDIADMVVATLTQPRLRNQLFEITGPELLSFKDCLQQISDAIGETVNYHGIPVDEFISAAKQNGMPDQLAWLMNELFTEVLDGRNAFTTHTIEQVLERPAKTFKEYVTQVVKTGVWNSPSVEATAS